MSSATFRRSSHVLLTSRSTSSINELKFSTCRRYFGISCFNGWRFVPLNPKDGKPVTHEPGSILRKDFNLDLVTGVEDSYLRTVPDRYNLGQNYPNPFNPITTIEFYLPKAANVRIDIINLLGQSVETLVNQRYSKRTHKKIWNGTGYPTGMYFYRIITPEFEEVRKMMLIK